MGGRFVVAFSTMIAGVATEGFCREHALREPIAGTANFVQRWILVEDQQPWGRKVPGQTSLAPETRAWLDARSEDPRTRIQLIRRSGATVEGETRKVFLVASTAEPGGRRVVGLDLSEVELVGLDVDAQLAAAPPSPRLADLVLVCTHGVRDPCCAKWGMPVYEALRARAPARVWQCSHLGGHRFAPTFLTLPSGLLWARTGLDELAPILDALDAGQLARLDRLRGRCAYAPPVQVAEIELRAREQLLDDAALVLRGHEARDDGSHVVRFARPWAEGAVETELEVRARALPEPTPSNCGEAPSPRETYALGLPRGSGLTD